jgi:hypothetical protein
MYFIILLFRVLENGINYLRNHGINKHVINSYHRLVLKLKLLHAI